MTFFKFQLEYFCNQAELHATLDHCVLMDFKKVQNQTSNQATINQKVNGNLKRKRRKRSNL